MSHTQRPLTLPVHPKLLLEINQMSMAIKVWHLMDWQTESRETMDKLTAHNPNPTWKEVEELLMKCYHAINEQRDNPIKY